MMKRGCVKKLRAGFVALVCFFALCASGQGGEQLSSLSARQVFLYLPSSILDNLGEGLSDNGKYELLTRGRSGNWAMRSTSRDWLEMESFSDPDTLVNLCLYRGERNLAAMGSDFGPFCITELWRLQADYGATPIDPPRDPHITDFFRKDRRIPSDVSVSMTFCARPEGLEVKPQFWSPTGRARLRPDNAVFYIWTGKRFSKRIVPLYDQMK